MDSKRPKTQIRHITTNAKYNKRKIYDMKKCEHDNCTRTATSNNLEYHPDKWLCTYHANKKVVDGRRKRKYGNRTVSKGMCCEPVGEGFYLGTSCPICKQPFRQNLK